ncbi:MAG: hypothetical protein KZQ73_14440 [Candidatus Thiodiazotropha sp. (ex Semelilucina semeliformis)]|nr:hypothetical protein [Candidatus Thiodiazotropha sp. (ex Semelilucina semeliformis)]
MTINTDRQEVQYFDWEGFICRTIGDIFSGRAERFIAGKGWNTAHFADLLEKGDMLTEREALTRLRRINGFDVFAAKAKHYDQTKH